MASANDYINAAARYIGVGGTDNIFNTWIWGRHVYDPFTYPWCAAFQSYVGVHDLGMPFEPSASAAGVAWQGWRVDVSDAQPGDWVLFNWDGRQDFGWADHIGLVEWFDHESGYFGTIEGNTGGGEGIVARCTRSVYNGYACAFFRPPYDEAPTNDESTKPNGKKGRKMECIIRPNGENYLVYFDGTDAHPLAHPDEATAINEVYKRCNGTDMPMFEFGSKDAPWATRLFEGASRKW